MIVLEDARCVILHIPKCAGKNLRQAFRPDDPEGKYWHWKFVNEVGRWVDAAHMTLDVLKELPEWDLIKTYTVIGIVRNPIDRFLSAIKEHNSQHSLDFSTDLLSVLDEVRICYDPRYIHFCPQHRFTHIGNKRYVDFVARVENLADDLKAIGIKAGLNTSFFDAIKRIESYSGGVASERANAVDERTLQHIIRLYYRDFLLFGYEAPQIDGAEVSFGSEFEQLLISHHALAEWDGDQSARPAYDRLRAVEKLKAEYSALIKKVAELEVERKQQLEIEADFDVPLSRRSRARRRSVAAIFANKDWKGYLRNKAAKRLRKMSEVLMDN